MSLATSQTWKPAEAIMTSSATLPCIYGAFKVRTKQDEKSSINELSAISPGSSGLTQHTTQLASIRPNFGDNNEDPGRTVHIFGMPGLRGCGGPYAHQQPERQEHLCDNQLLEYRLVRSRVPPNRVIQVRQSTSHCP